MSDSRSNDGERAADRFIESALLVDLEVSHQGRILKLGALVGTESFVAETGLGSAALERLASFVARSTCVLGHNLFAHDLRILKEKHSTHPLLNLPIVDTLLLSPIAFPENPYHRLIKDYKLVRESINDPLADARQAATLFRDEVAALMALRTADPHAFDLLHFLLATPEHSGDVLAEGMEMVFSSLGNQRPSQQEALEHCQELFRQYGCRSVQPTHLMVQTRTDRLALAYAVAWLRVSGSNSVLAAWVRHQHPQTVKLIESLREVPCADTECSYCRRVHNAEQQLKLFFQDYTDFRATPRNPTGGSLQKDIVECGMRNESLLAILPTGGGKSFCFQLPALVRNYRRGVLTIVISPLQALMKDQVDGLVRRTGTPFAAALYGLLTQPERADVLERVRLGDVAILYISPEQLRNKSFRKVIEQREIGCWIFDEAHCLSKWGHDFRPDYLYAGRFIREFSKEHGGVIPPIGCFTATAKAEVKEEIVAYFKQETGRELIVFEGGVERDNLRFAVQGVSEHGKLERLHDLLSDYLGSKPGSGIVFHSTRNATEQSAQFLKARGWKAAHFHAGMSAPQKKQLQDEFLGGEVKVICATNAFGMGIDKEDVRLVVHADTPGSLENYLQEAGRAGRDGKVSDCILLYDEADCEKQFRMSAMSELTRRDIAEVLRSIRRSARGQEEAIVTTGEILRDETFDGDIDLQERSADTKVRTAVAWLERARFLERDENVTNVFQARLLVTDVKEAKAKIEPLNLSQTEQGLWLAVVREIMNAQPTDPLTVDQLALLPEFTRFAELSPGPTNPESVSAKILKVLGSMTDAGMLKRDTLLTCFIRHKVLDHSRLRLERTLHADRKLLDLMITEAPDPEGWMSLSLRAVNQRLTDEGCTCSVETIRNLLRSLSQDGRGFAGSHGSIDMRFVSRDHYRIKLGRTWSAIRELAEKRNRVASVLFNHLESKIPSGTHARAELLVEFSFEELQEEIKQDLELRHELKDFNAALERGLMFLHEQHVIVLQQGLAIFRSAMTIRLKPTAKGEQYKNSDYRPLHDHYKERTLQVHVMNRFGQLGLQRIDDALELARCYFTDGKTDFIRRFFDSNPDLVHQATTAASYQRIVTDLGNRTQIAIVTAPATRNMLVLAGPGSGKTKTVVHRCAYLLRVERVRPQSILMCCFNRQAAVDLRRRLNTLVGTDARQVTVLTYHGLALRLLGRSFNSDSSRDQVIDFDALIKDAVRLLRGEDVPFGMEADEVRDRLLTGFQYLLVDEYQDIDSPQYEMISAIAGRTLADPDAKLSIMAVGDDDQNIYSFRGTNVEFIRRFERDYGAETHYLVENYRSTRYIIEAANHLISANTDRMKVGKPIRIDSARELLPAGGEVEERDLLAAGKVLVTQVDNLAAQTAAVLDEIGRVTCLGVKDLSRICVLSSMNEDLAWVRSAAEHYKIPVRWYASRGSIPPLHQIREIHRFLERLKADQSSYMSASELLAIEKHLPDGADNQWSKLLREALEAWKVESRDSVTSVKDALEFLYESLADCRRDFSFGQGVTLSTVHSAKGMEYDHVLLIGPWRMDADAVRAEEQRRVLYVGMTRAKKTLSLFQRFDAVPSLIGDLVGNAVARQTFERKVKNSGSRINYSTLSMDEIDLGYAGRLPSSHEVHTALRALQPGDTLHMRYLEGRAVELFTRQGTCVARLSRKGTDAWSERIWNVCGVRVQAVLHRARDQDPEETRREMYLSTEWEVPVIEVYSCE